MDTSKIVAYAAQWAAENPEKMAAAGAAVTAVAADVVLPVAITAAAAAAPVAVVGGAVFGIYKMIKGE